MYHLIEFSVEVSTQTALKLLYLDTQGALTLLHLDTQGALTLLHLDTQGTLKLRDLALAGAEFAHLDMMRKCCVLVFTTIKEQLPCVIDCSERKNTEENKH